MMSAAAMALVFSGCAGKPSPYANDPRTAGVNQNTLYPWLGPVPGPNYLDYVMKYPPDRDTQAHHPHIELEGKRVASLNTVVAPTNAPPTIQALLTPTPLPRLK